MKIIRESLNKLDLIGIDNNNYYDLRNLYEAVEPRMTPQDKQELRKLIDVTDNPETISAYLKSKDESLNESEDLVYSESEETINTDYNFEKYKDLVDKLWDYFKENDFYPEDIYQTSEGFIVDIDGDWKHDHIYGNMLLKDFLDANNIKAVIDTVPVGESDDDSYYGHHVVKILSLDEDLQLRNINEDYIVEGTDSGILSLTSELFDLLSQIKSTANKLIIELENKGDKSNANLVNVDVLLELEDSNIYDTLQDIMNQYDSGLSEEVNKKSLTTQIRDSQSLRTSSQRRESLQDIIYNAAKGHSFAVGNAIFTKEEDTPGSTWEVSGNPTGLSNRYYGDDLVRMLANKEYINK